MSVVAKKLAFSSEESSPLLQLRGISKSFAGVQALDNVSFDVRAGEVHMLLGENGAGKSTLMKILCGAYTADTGDFIYEGEKVEIAGPADALKFGVSVIFQEFSLVPYLDIGQNIFLGREFKSSLPGFVDHKRIRTEARKVLSKIGFDVDPSCKVHELGVAQQQMVEIAKALSQNARILVMDEPTAALSERETEQLFQMIAKLKSEGVAIIYISHRMSEVFELGDRITVLRDGKLIGEVLPSQTTPSGLVKMMVGRSVDSTYARNFSHKIGPVVLEVGGLSSSNGIENINLNVRQGEIVGLCGLVGSGRTEVVRAIFGVDNITAGTVRVAGETRWGGPDVAASQGIALVPENRKTEGLALIRTVRDNLIVAGLAKFFANGIFSPSKAQSIAKNFIAKLRIATSGPSQTAGVLSGGNQQKIVIGKWLAAGAKLFILDEPTRGVDIGAKAEIYALVDELVSQGAAVLLISSEQIEIVHVCDRAYVMRDGKIAGELDRKDLSEENIVKLGMQHD